MQFAGTVVIHGSTYFSIDVVLIAMLVGIGLGMWFMHLAEINDEKKRRGGTR